MSDFGIGTYQSISGGMPYGGTSPTGTTVMHPWSGTYGGTYGYVLDTTIRGPQRAVPTPAAEIGIDTASQVVVRGYPKLTWSWSTLHPQYWYQFQYIYQQAARAPIGFQFLVLLQYPDPSQSGGSLTQVLARMEPPTHNNRSVAAYFDVQLHFTYVGQFQLDPSTPVVVLS